MGWDSIYSSMKRRIVPALTHSELQYRDALLGQLKARPRWLDLGCGHQFAPDWAWEPPPDLMAQLPRIAGIDGDFSSIRRHRLLKDRILGDISALPFAPASFDLVTANMVMEHVRDPERVLREAGRVLAPNGVFLFHTPNLGSPLVFAASITPERPKKAIVRLLEKRMEEDLYPTAYSINTVPRAVRVGREAGFEIERCSTIVSEALTWRLGPLAVFELLWIRAAQSKFLAPFRNDIIAIFRKP